MRQVGIFVLIRIVYPFREVEILFVLSQQPRRRQFRLVAPSSTFPGYTVSYKLMFDALLCIQLLVRIRRFGTDTSGGVLPSASVLVSSAPQWSRSCTVLRRSAEVCSR